MEISWTSSPPPPVYSSQERESGLTIVLRCPKLSPLALCLPVYLCVTGGIGVSLSILWVIGHLYVLCHTSEYSLREQRYVDVCVGVSLLISQSCLVMGVRNKKIQHILVFLILSTLVICGYWAWWAGLYYHKSETEASKELFDTLSMLSLVFLVFLILPSLPFYKHLENKNTEAAAQQGSNDDHQEKLGVSQRFEKLPYTICQ